MAKQNLASLPMSALVQLRDRVSSIISRRADALKRELRSLGEDYKEVGRIAIYGKKKAKSQNKTRRTTRRKTARMTNARSAKTSARTATASARSTRKSVRPRRPARTARR